MPLLRTGQADFPYIRLLGSFQSEFCEPAPELLVKTIGIVPVLKAGQKVIGEANGICFTTTLPAASPIEPEVQYVSNASDRI